MHVPISLQTHAHTDTHPDSAHTRTHTLSPPMHPRVAGCTEQGPSPACGNHHLLPRKPWGPPERHWPQDTVKAALGCPSPPGPPPRQPLLSWTDSSSPHPTAPSGPSSGLSSGPCSPGPPRPVSGLRRWLDHSKHCLSVETEADSGRAGPYEVSREHHRSMEDIHEERWERVGWVPLVMGRHSYCP